MNTPIHDKLAAELERPPRWRRDELAVAAAIALLLTVFCVLVAVQP